MTKEEIKKLADKMLKNGLTAPDAAKIGCFRTCFYPRLTTLKRKTAGTTAKTAVSTIAFPPSMAGGDGILKRRNS